MHKNIVHLNKLQFQWPCQKVPLLDIDELSIDTGKRIFIKGPSGNGKMTLLKILAGVLTPSSSFVEILGLDIGTMHNACQHTFRPENIGFVFDLKYLLLETDHEDKSSYTPPAFFHNSQSSIAPSPCCHYRAHPLWSHC